MASNAATVREFMELFPTDDAVSALRDPDAFRARFAPLADRAWPDFQVVMVGPTSAARIEYRGIDGLVEAWTDWVSAFETHRTEFEGVEEVGDSVLVLVHQVATPSGASAPVENSGATVVAFRDGKLATIEFHINRDEARRSVGLSD